ncbi:DUF4380 domain-containing protein [Frigoribacterium sp. CFBP 13729]|uniref:DUF4380 domain-containing protein n=1 Tax=Frigoribacterium sp. CFBP 13729 TaxID=2775293 RepID=UPI00177AB090|nr:DUF4380 domain-containing protein [Frigoribacterium sp. CFBP 13729]MBD8608929.1 DUF4380 domain-containing protein [Frigoribacterium sp. CFBP 13729]
MTVVVERTGRADLPLLRVTTDELVLAFAPTRGGRLLSLVAGGRELLWQNPELVGADLVPLVPVADWPASDGGMDTWANLGGSKTWPAPQGWSGPDEWAGPPDPVLDSGPWTAEWEADDAEATVTLTSGDDPRTGLRVVREFRLLDGTSSFTERVTFTNTSGTSRRWAIWEVCQVDTGGPDGPDGRAARDAVVVVPHVNEAVELDLGTYEGELHSTRRGRDVALPLGTGVAKRGYPDASGSVELHGPDGLEIGLATAPDGAGTWPDGGSKVEVWLQRPTAAPIESLEGLHPSAHLVELEVLGPLTTLAPGATATLDVEWSTARL